MPSCHPRTTGSVLVVMPDLDVRQEICALLASAGHHVHAVEDLAHGLQCARHPEFDFHAMVVSLPENHDTAEQYALLVRKFLPCVSLVLLSDDPSCTSEMWLVNGRLIGWMRPPLSRAGLLRMVRATIEQAARVRSEVP